MSINIEHRGSGHLDTPDEIASCPICSPRGRLGKTICPCGMAWLGTIDHGMAEQRDHAHFRASGGETGPAHDPGLATFTPDRPAIVPAPTPAITECNGCSGAGWIAETTADPLPSGEPGEPYQIQIGCGACGGTGRVPFPGAAEEGRP